MLTCEREILRKLSSLVVGGAALLALSGCLREDENALVVTGPDSAVAVVALTTPAFLLPPTGTAVANRLELISFDASALDAFGRANEPYQSDEWPYFDSDGFWLWGTDEGTAGWGTAANDPRLPVPTHPGTPCGTAPCYDFDFFYFAQQGVFASAGYDLYGEWCCAAPTTRYVVSLDRMQLTVNGELDATQVLLGEAVDQPDELSWIGGSPGGDYTRRADLFNTGDPYPAEPDANPFVLGYFETDADGYVYIDAVVNCNSPAGVPTWNCGPTDTDVSHSIVAPNEAVRHTFPNYNYFTIWETDGSGAPDYSRPLVRYQLGVDLSSFGGPINNAYAPFPRASLSDAELALGKGGVSRADTVAFRAENVEELGEGASYQAFALLDDNSTQRLDFVYTNVRLKEDPVKVEVAPGDTITLTEDTLSGPTVTGAFSGGPDLHEVKVEFPDNATHVFLTIETDDDDAPSARQILWAEGLQGAGQAKQLSLGVSFGSFSEGRTWAIGGTGKGGLFGDEFRVRYNDLPRPPVGYQYMGWLASGDTTFARLADETFTSPPPTYTVLADADTDPEVSPVVQPLTILEAFTRFCVGTRSGCFDLSQYDTFILTLEPKAGQADVPSPTRVLSGLLP